MRIDIYHHYQESPAIEVSKIEVSILAQLAGISRTQEKIVSQISDYAGRVNAKFDAISTGIDGIKGDVDFLKAQIATLQNSPGVLSAEDQATLDATEQRLNGLADRVTAVDAETAAPPAPPAP